MLAAIADLRRPGGRLLLDVHHRDDFEARQGRNTEVRDERCRATTNTLDGTRLTSAIEYVDGTTESMDWEVFTPDEIPARAAPTGLRGIERCAWWTAGRDPGPDDRRFQVVLEKETP